MKMLTVCFIFFRGMQNKNVDCFIFFGGMQNENVDLFFQRFAEWKCWLFILFFSEICRMKMLTVCFIFFRGMQNKTVDCFIFFRGMENENVDLFFSEVCRMKMLTSFYFFQRYAEWKCWLLYYVGRHIVFVLSVCPSHNLSAQLLWNYWTEFHETW